MAMFDFSEEDIMFQRMCRDFCVKELRPHYKENLDKTTIPPDLVKRMGDVGMLGVMQPEKYGGQPGSYVMLGIIGEEVSREFFDLGMIPAMTRTVCDGAMVLNEEKQKEIIPKSISGDYICSFAMTEPEVGSDAAHIRMKADRDGDYYILNGEKTSISYACQAEYGLVFAITDATKGARGISAFVVPFNLQGIEKTAIPYFGAKGMGESSVIFDNVRLPAEYRVGEEGAGFIWGMEDLDWMRASLALQDSGLALISLEETMEYVKGRYAFGQPIGKFEGVSFKIVENLAQVEAGRLLAYKALWLNDVGRTREATDVNAMAKYFLPRASMKAIWDCVLLHGYLGYSEEYPLMRRMVDSIAWQIGDGTREIMDTILVRDLLGRDMVAYKR